MRAAALILLAAAPLLGAAPAPKTVIKGARMDVLQKGEAMEFTGGVTLTRGDDFMSADRMVNHEKEGVTHAWGHVYLKRLDRSRSAVLEAWGDEGVYDSSASSGSLWGGVFVEMNESTPTARVTRMWADKAEYDDDSGSVRFTGAPRLEGPRARGLPPWPAGDRPRPRALQKEGEETRDLSGQTVTYYQDGGRIVADGDVRTAWEGGKLGPAR